MSAERKGDSRALDGRSKLVNGTDQASKTLGYRLQINTHGFKSRLTGALGPLGI